MQLDFLCSLTPGLEGHTIKNEIEGKNISPERLSQK